MSGRPWLFLARSTPSVPGQSRERKSRKNAVASPEIRIVSSKTTGMKAGRESKGLPPTFSGQLTAEVQYWSHSPRASPTRPGEGDPAQTRGSDAEHVVEPVDGEGRDHVDDRDAARAALACRVE